jgi:squalene-hopene/tetraprenyl-beta-curcumene cyclase
MSKALTLYGVKSVETKSGSAAPWARTLGLKLINLQKTDGSWANENNRWWEKDPALVTAYTVMALEFASRGLK